MALTRRNIWYSATPGWAGNREQERPFDVEVARKTDGEVTAFRDAALAVHRRWLEGDEAPPVEELAQLFDGYLRGPSIDVEIDGETVKAGDLRGLLEQARAEYPLGGCLFLELLHVVLEANLLSEVARKNWSRRRGGTGSTETQSTAAAATPLPPAAPPAAV